ncbi:MAG: rhomboid family intramembrane serine protease, partial [Alphaproteobacteria bacterium]
MTWSTILLCAVVLAWQSGLGQQAEWQASYSFGFSPGVLFSDFGRPPAISLLPSELTLVTYQFLHGGVGHLLSNMVVLFVFGGVIEDRLGHWKFGLLYLTSGVVAGLAHGLVFSEGTTALVGASGSIAGVMGAYLLLFPRAKI